MTQDHATQNGLRHPEKPVFLRFLEFHDELTQEFPSFKKRKEEKRSLERCRILGNFASLRQGNGPECAQTLRNPGFSAVGTNWACVILASRLRHGSL